MKTLLQVGDMVKIRDDIEYFKNIYHMKMHNSDGESYTHSMLEPGTTVTIIGIRGVNLKHVSYKVKEDPIMNYVDEMFDPELIEYLYEQMK